MQISGESSEIDERQTDLKLTLHGIVPCESVTCEKSENSISGFSRKSVLQSNPETRQGADLNSRVLMADIAEPSAYKYKEYYIAKKNYTSIP